jgi:outer membrane protein TolC
VNLGPVNIPAIENRYGVGLNIIQSAYTGGRIKGLKDSAGLQKQLARHEQRSATADLVLQALAAYWNWSKAYYALDSLRAAVVRMEAHAQNMRNLHQAGLATENDALATEVLLDRTRLRREDANRRVEAAAARLAYLTGQRLPENSQPQQALARINASVSPEADLLHTARFNRAERDASETQAKLAEIHINVSKAELYPQVSLVARYEQGNPNMNIFPPRDRWKDDAFAGINVSWNIFDWGLTKAKVGEATARAEQARLKTAQIDDQIALEVREARISLQDALARLTVAERVETSAQRNLKAATDLWQNGLARHSDVLDAHAQLTDTQFEIIAARTDVVLAEAALGHAIGRLAVLYQ